MPDYTLTDDEVHSEDSGAAAVGPIDFVVPTNERWRLMAAAVEVVASGSGLGRQVGIQLLDTTSAIRAKIDSGLFPAQAAGETVYFDFAIGSENTATEVGNSANVPIAQHHVPGGWTIRVTDNAGRDPANDTYAVLLSVIKQEE